MCSSYFCDLSFLTLSTWDYVKLIELLQVQIILIRAISLRFLELVLLRRRVWFFFRFHHVFFFFCFFLPRHCHSLYEKVYCLKKKKKPWFDFRIYSNLFLWKQFLCKFARIVISSRFWDGTLFTVMERWTRLKRGRRKSCKSSLEKSAALLQSDITQRIDSKGRRAGVVDEGPVSALCCIEHPLKHTLFQYTHFWSIFSSVWWSSLQIPCVCVCVYATACLSVCTDLYCVV